MVKLAAMEKDVVTVSTDYDSDNWLFNVQNGTINLKTGELLPHNRKNLCNKISRVTYDPAASCPLFEKFLSEVQEDKAMIDFLAQAVGYSMSGDTGEQALFFTHGNGANGKSVFNLAVMSIMGDYAKVAAFETFVQKRNDTGPKNDLAALVGARLVQAAESKEGARLDESLIKSITGGEEVTVRFLHKEFFSYTPAFKIWMSSNSKPVIGGTDHGIWRRMKMIPFDVTVTVPDKWLSAKLRKEAAGILNWALRGLSSYHAKGLMYPEKVQAAILEYRDSQDVIGQFLKTRCVLMKDAEIKGAELYASYRTWADANGEWPMKERKFTESLLKVPGITRKNKSDGKWYLGVGQTSYTKTYDMIPQDVEVI